MENKRIVLIDGNSLVYRAFFALPTTLTTASGQVTNAVYGFTSMLLKLLRDEKPDVVVAAFDRAAPTFRHEAFAEYKAHREKMPDELYSQLPLVKDVLNALKIPIFEIDGYEADDILATLASAAEHNGAQVTIVTGDRDAFQLVSPRVRIMTTRKGISDIVIYDRDAVIERYGVGPEKMADLLGLKGDTSDNIPGIPGVGEKTASKLIQQFGSLEGVYERVNEVKGDKLRTKLTEHEEQARLSKKLAILDRQVPVPTDLGELRLGEWDAEEVRQLFAALQFDTLWQRFLADEEGGPATAAAGKSIQAPGVEAISTEPQLRGIFEGLGEGVQEGLREHREAGGEAGSPIAVEVDAGPGGPTAIGLCVPSRDQARSYDISPALADTFRAALSGEAKRGRTLQSHDLKAVLTELDPDLCPGPDNLFDTGVAAYLLNPADASYPLDGLCAKYLGKGLLPARGDAPAKGQAPAYVRAVAVAELVPHLERALEKGELTGIFRDVEMTLVPVLARMERVGVGIDAQYLSVLSTQVQGEVQELESRIFELVGEEFNIGSPQQVGTVLFDKLGLKTGKRTKTGYSTDMSVLRELAASHPVCEEILHWRELTKLRSTYMDALPRLVNPKTGRVHTSFNQTITATGRLSSSNPNLQNIPVRTELGHRIRDAFVPGRPGDLLMVADYSQIELRILAHLSEDEALAAAFANDADIHTATASEVFETPPEDVTADLRRRAKAINFGLVYGMSASGLARQLGIEREEAQAYIERYFARYPAVKEYITKMIAAAYRDGYVTTLLGRRRWIPELKSGNVGVRNFGERTAVNSPIQGSAADIIKLAMVRLDRMIIDEGLLTRMVLQVHDELVFEVPPIEEEQATKMVRAMMEGAYPLSVPVRVHMAVGANWGDAE